MRTLSIAILLASLAAPALAQQVVVQKVTGASYRPGQIMACTDHIRLAGGQHLTMMDSAGYKIMREGPYDGPAAQCATASKPFLNRLMGIMERQNAFTRVGAVRTRLASDELCEERTVLNIGKDTTYCLPASGTAPCLYAQPGTGLNTFALAGKDGSSAIVEMPADVDTVPWPTELPLRPGARFTVATANEPTVSTVSIVASPSGSGLAYVEALEGRGCLEQAAKALLQSQ